MAVQIVPTKPTLASPYTYKLVTPPPKSTEIKTTPIDQVSVKIPPQFIPPKNPNPFVPPKTTVVAGGGGGGGGGYSYQDPATGKGYEVSPIGEVKEIIPDVPAPQIETPRATPYYGGGGSNLPLDKYDRTFDIETFKRNVAGKITEGEPKINYYAQPIAGYYNKKTGEFKSFPNETLAAEQGFVKVKSLGTTAEGKTVIESPTRLLTPNELAVERIVEANPKTAVFFGGSPTAGQIAAGARYGGQPFQETVQPMGTTFIVGGDTSSPNFLEVVNLPTTPYDVARVSTAKPININIVPGLLGAEGTASAITASDITTLGFGATGLIKGGLLVGTQILFAKPITEIYSKGVQAISSFAPIGTKQLISGTLYGLGTPIVGTAYATEIGKAAIKDPILTLAQITEQTVTRLPETLAMIATSRVNIFETSFLGKKPYQIELTAEQAGAIEPFTRQRATVLLKNTDGKYILGKTKGGEIISIGGGIEKGQTPRTAALAELKQETGLNIKDLVDFKFKEKIIFPEETFYTYTATLRKGAKPIAASDINKIVYVNPKSLFIKGTTGQTPIQPVSRFSLFPFGRIRAYEAGIINYLETGIKPTALAIDTKTGTYFLGTQSRYDVPYSQQSKFLKQEELLLASGTTEPPILRRYSFNEKEFVVSAKKSKRGSAKGLFIQPPVSISKLFGFEEKFLRKGEPVYLKTRVPKFDILKASTYKYKITGRKPGTFYKFGGDTGGYVGLSYAGFKTTQASESLGLKIGRMKREVLILKENPQITKAIKETPYTKKGVEEELILNPETKVITAGRARIYSIGLKRVYLQPTKIIDTKTGKILSNEMKISEGRYTYVSPQELTPFRSLSQKQSSQVSLVKQIKSSSIILYKKTRGSEISLKEPESIVRLSSQSVSPFYKEPSVVKQYNYLAPYKTTSRKEINYYLSDKNILPITLIKKSKDKEKRKLKQVPTFEVQLKRRGKFKPISTGLTREQALVFGSEKALGTLGRTFKISPTGKTKEIFGIEESNIPELKAFRPYKIKQGKQIATPNQYIQRTEFNLKSLGEQSEIQLAKKRKGFTLD